MEYRLVNFASAFADWQFGVISPRQMTGNGRYPPVEWHRNLRGSSMAEEHRSRSLLQGSCHCGSVRITLPTTPEKANKCNCSICRRLGAVWVYYEFGTVEIEGHPQSTAEYIWGDKTLRTVHCRTCGCVTHWEPLGPKPGARHGVNLNNFDARLQDSVQVRRIDGADTWAFLD